MEGIYDSHTSQNPYFFVTTEQNQMLFFCRDADINYMPGFIILSKAYSDKFQF